jgi:hypothetical protein
MAHDTSNDIIYKEYKSLIGQPKAGTGDCVALGRTHIPELKDRPTYKWMAGDRVMDVADELKPGTAIATFLCGVYPQHSDTGQHFAIFVRVTKYRTTAHGKRIPTEIEVLDQWKGPTKPVISLRPIRSQGSAPMSCSGGYTNASNTLEAFYVIQKNHVRP